jgi:phenylacetate-coenzyme A ligase PaaK-like adenylate-forming protein
MGPPPARTDPWGPLHSSLAGWNWLARTSDIWWTRSAGPAMVAAARRARLSALIAFARTRSAFYREAYRDVPARDARIDDLPVVTRRRLMARFDDWVTDPEVTRAGVEAFIADRERIGERYLGRYVLWKSSGTTGEPGIFVQDADALDVCDALIAAQFDAAGLAQRFAHGMITHGGRAALIAATGEHFATVASWRRLGGGSPWFASRCLSVMEPLPRLVAELNAYQPAFVASYPTMLFLLAGEKSARRLTIAPACLWSGGEYLAPAARTEIERAFDCPIANEYGASECMSIAFGCREGWLHVNADWVVLEAVDRDYRPTPPGAPSHTALLTNLANRVQPVIRYDLGDSIIVKPEPCACGNPLPAIQVEGRRDDIVALAAADGRIVRLLPLALSTVVEEATGVHRFQIVQDAADRLRLRLDVAGDSARQAAWRLAAAALRDYLRHQSLPNVRVALDRRPPATEPRSGKLRQVVVVRGS